MLVGYRGTTIVQGRMVAHAKFGTFISGGAFVTHD